MRKMLRICVHTGRYIRKYPGLALLIGLAYINTYLLVYRNSTNGCSDGRCGFAIVDTYFHDTFWHVAIATVSFVTLPFRSPILAGYPLQGYHYLYDWVMYVFSFVGISPLFFYWRLSPFLYITTLAVIAIYVGRKIVNSPVFVGLLLFFLYFGGTASFIANAIVKGSPFGYGVSSLLHTSTTALYPTVGYGFVCLLVAIAILIQPRKTIRHIFILAFLLFLSMGIKFYSGATLLVMLLVYELVQAVTLKKFRKFFLHIFVYGVFFVAALVIFYQFPAALKNEPVLSWAPLATVRPVIEDEYIYRVENLILARQTLQGTGFSPRLIAIELLTIVLFLFHHFGTRLLGFFYLMWKIIIKKAGAFDYACVGGILFSTFAAMMFVQRGDQWWNSMQFLYFSAFLSSMYTAQALYILLKSGKRSAQIIVVIILILTIPNTFEKIAEMHRTKSRIISQNEIAALAMLKKQPDGVVFTVPLMPDTAYISALSAKPSYFADEQILENTGLPYKKRKALLSKPDELDLNAVASRYVYLVKADKYFALFKRKAQESSYTKLFENKEIIIFSREK